MPKVSIIIPSYNHEKYIRECLQSALNQDYQDFEIIITDDGSSDRSVEIIKEFTDPRIHLFVHPHNQGACVTMNHCLQQARGEYIGVLNSDDAWEPTKLGKQVRLLDKEPELGAVFTKVAFIDENSQKLAPEDYKHYYVFEQNNRSRYAWLNQFFYKGNCLCHPGILIRQQCYNRIGGYNERMANVPDLDMWVRLCLNYEILILDEKLVRFRILRNEANASADNLTTHIRARFEFKQILDHYLAIRDKETLLKVFPEASKYGEVENAYIPYFLSKLSLDASISTSHLWGLELLYNFMENPEAARGLEKKYGFTCLDFHRLTAQRDVFNITPAIVGQQNAPRMMTPAKARKRNIFFRAAIRLHWMLANTARKYILK